MTLRCYRGGSYRNTRRITDEQRKRDRTTRLINCPFQIKGVKRSDGLWVVELKDYSQNHKPSDDISGHPLYHRLSSDDKEVVEQMSKSGASPRQILSTLRKKDIQII